MTNSSMPSKKDDPNYAQVSGFIPKELTIRFRTACVENELGVSEGLEVAIAAWLEILQQKKVGNAQED